jgi:hypothetical protein
MAPRVDQTKSSVVTEQGFSGRSGSNLRVWDSRGHVRVAFLRSAARRARPQASEAPWATARQIDVGAGTAEGLSSDERDELRRELDTRVFLGPSSRIVARPGAGPRLSAAGAADRTL